MYNLLEYSDIYSKTTGMLWEYYRDKPALNKNNVIIDFPADGNNRNSFKFKQKITWQSNNDEMKNVGSIKISKYFSENA